MVSDIDTLVTSGSVMTGTPLPEYPIDQEESGDKPVSKSARVREYLEANPEARNKDVASALQQYGVKGADVANVKAQLRRKAEKDARLNEYSRPQSKPTASASEAVESNELDVSIQLDQLDAAVAFVKKAGGINEAQHLLRVISRIRSLN